MADNSLYIRALFAFITRFTGKPLVWSKTRKTYNCPNENRSQEHNHLNVVIKDDVSINLLIIFLLMIAVVIVIVFVV